MLATKDLISMPGERIEGASHKNCGFGIFNFDLPQASASAKESAELSADVYYTNKRLAIKASKQWRNFGLITEEFCLSVDWGEIAEIRTRHDVKREGQHIRGVLLKIQPRCSIFFGFWKAELHATHLWLLSTTYMLQNHPDKISEKSPIWKTDWIVPDQDQFNGQYENIKKNAQAAGILIEVGKAPSRDLKYKSVQIPRRDSGIDLKTEEVSEKTIKKEQDIQNPIVSLSLITAPKIFGDVIYTLTRWHKQDGEAVSAGDKVCSVRNDWGLEKDVLAYRSGYLQILQDGVNERYASGEVLGRVIDLPLNKEMPIQKPSGNNSKTVARQIEGNINSLIGLNSVKKKVKSLIDIAIVNNERESKGLPGRKPGLHMVFTGNPGTGKTTIARKMGEILKQIGFLSRGHFVETDREGLVGGYLGQTAIKTKQVLENSIGGVLFIDEAYTLSSIDANDKFGKEAIDTLLTFMENNKNDLVVIVAGYSEEMENFLESNPGLRSRFMHNLHFEDYSALELKEIFMAMTTEGGYQLTPESEKGIEELMQIIGGRRERNFANAREVRNIYELILGAQASRIMLQRSRTEMDLILIQEDDIKMVFDQKKGSVVNRVTTKQDGTLEDMIGINGVKKEVRTLINSIKVRKMREAMNVKTEGGNLHIVFTGNPGTGKTTVARYLAKEFCKIGLISSEKLIEIDRGDLVAGHQGQTAIKAKKIFESALGGILFIDEAYDLSRGLHDDFGAEATSCLLKYMEDNRENLIVICAGYEKQMNIFLQSNPGLRSRFNRFIHFEDYDADELTLIFKRFCSSQQVLLTPAAEIILVELIDHMVFNKSTDFANGRTVRNLFEKVLERQANRIIEKGITGEHELQTIEAADISREDVIPN